MDYLLFVIGEIAYAIGLLTAVLVAIVLALTGPLGVIIALGLCVLKLFGFLVGLSWLAVKALLFISVFLFLVKLLSRFLINNP